MQTKRPTFGVGLFPTESPRRMIELAKLAEDLGYSSAYIGDSQMIWREAYVILGAIAVNTSRITLGVGVTNPLTRDLSVIAAAWITLHEMTRGRVLLGIGIGDSSVETLNKKPATLAELERSIEFIRGLIRGETLPHPESGSPVRITYASPGMHIPVYPAVSSPKIHRLAGRIGDELMTGAGEVGRDLGKEGFRVVCWTPCSIQDDGDAARNAVKPHVARILKRKLPFELDAGSMEVVRRIRETYEYYDHMVPGSAHSEVVPDEMVEKFAIAGTPAEAKAQLERLIQTSSVDEIAIIPHAQRPEDRDRIIRVVGEVIGAA